MENFNETSLHGSLGALEEESEHKSAQDLNEYLQIITKPGEEREPREIALLATKLDSLNIFDRNLLDNMDPKVIIRKIIPFFKYEHFPAGTPIFHYEQPADKVYIIMKGKAKEFEAKKFDVLEKESRYLYRIDSGIKDIPVSMPDFPNNASLNSVSNIPEESLATICEQAGEEKENTTPFEVAKKFKKIKAVLPFLKKMIDQKTATQRINDYSYKQSLRRALSHRKSFDYSGNFTPDSAPKEIDMLVMEEFKKYPKAYFIGGILKVHFSKFLYGGDYCGLRALQDNALRTKAVIAEEDCHCISLHKDDFFKVLESEKKLNEDKITFFKKLFGKINEKRVIKFALGWEDVNLKLGDIVFQQNEPSDYLYALFKGEVLLSKQTPSPNKKTQKCIGELPFRIKKRTGQNGSVRVATLCAGDFFGDTDFFLGNKREFTASVSSVRAKVFQLSLKKYHDISRAYSDIFKEIKGMTGVKIKWNQERFEDLSNQNLNYPEKKERPLTENGNTFTGSLTVFPGSPNQNERLMQTPDGQKNDDSSKHQLFAQHKAFMSNQYNYQSKVEGRSWISIDERDAFGSPKSNSIANIENNRTMSRLGGTTEDLSKSIKETNSKSKTIFMENSQEGSMLLFSRAQIPRQYSTKFDEMLRKQKEALEESPEAFEPKKNASKNQIISPRKSKAVTLTRGASIQLLKNKILKSKPSEAMTLKMMAQSIQSIPSMELDTRVLSPIYNQTNNIPVVQSSLNSFNEKVLQKSYRPPSIEQKQRENSTSIGFDISGGFDNKKQFDASFATVKSIEQPANKVRPLPNGVLQIGLKCSIRARQKDPSKSLNHLNLVSPRKNNQFDKENVKGFRIQGMKANNDNMGVLFDKKMG